MAISARPIRKSANLPDTTFVLDNGAYNIKAGFASNDDSLPDTEHLKNCEVVPNCLTRSRDRKTYIAAQQQQIVQWSEAVFRRPIENGQLVSWEVEKEIWDHSFFEAKTAPRKCHITEPAGTTLVLTEQPNTMPALQRNTDEIVMEEYGFGGYARCIGQALNAFHDHDAIFSAQNQDASDRKTSASLSPIECLLVVDCGYSFTTVTPCFQGKPIQRAIRRLDLGGKHLTNLLKETISVRHFDLHQDTKVVNDIKEDVCFVSQNMKADMEKTWTGGKTASTQSGRTKPAQDGSSTELDRDQSIEVDYVLPDGVSLLRGFYRPHNPSATIAAARRRKQLHFSSADPNEVVMTLGNERFTIPEVLFTPSDIGSRQPGLAACILQSLTTLPPLIQATMLANTLVVGGTAALPGFIERLTDDLRSCVKTEWPVNVRKLSDPTTSTWLGGVRMSIHQRDILRSKAVTKAEYDEYGSNWLTRRFAGL